MRWVDYLAGLFVAHVVGDYLFQTEWQAVNKLHGLSANPTALRALATHVLTYTLACVPVLVWIANDEGAGLAVLVAALIALPHLVIDDGRIVRGWTQRVKGAGQPDPSLLRAVDQSFHIVSLWLVALLAAS